MSASTERKNRIAAREAGTDKKTIAAQEEAKKQAVSKRKWTWGTIGVIVLIAAILLLNSGLMYTSTTALTVDGTKFSPAEVNYYYGNEYLTMVNTYGQYLSYFGLDSSMGLAGLDDQECSMTDGGTWRDYFRDLAKRDLQQNRALLKDREELRLRQCRQALRHELRQRRDGEDRPPGGAGHDAGPEGLQ